MQSRHVYSSVVCLEAETAVSHKVATEYYSYTSAARVPSEDLRSPYKRWQHPAEGSEAAPPIHGHRHPTSGSIATHTYQGQPGLVTAAAGKTSIFTGACGGRLYMAAKTTRSVAVLVAVCTLVVAAEAAAASTTTSTVVAGMVFCDQCKDGARGLFDYPLYGVRVAIQCGGGESPLTVRESNTNWFGGFSIRMEGSPDMNRCTARVVQGTGHCGAAAAGAPRELTLAFRMLGLALYTVPPLLSQPEEAMDFCPGSNTSSSSAPQGQAPPFWRRRPRRLPPIWRRPPTLPQEQPEPRPAVPEPQLAPPPPPPPSPTPAQGTACAFEIWAAPEHRCYWKVVTPNTTVAMAFGPLAAQRYGSELTLREALEGRGDVYRTLLREATAALLNAYYNAPGGPFLYPTTASVIDHMNGALLSSAQRVLIEGARFRRANSGGGGPAGRTRLPCDFTTCGAAAAAPPMA